MPEGTLARDRSASSAQAPEDQNGNSRPHKRPRKPLNCEPCRGSKLKCDRNRPCSSCVLRGTSALCYRDGNAEDQGDAVFTWEDDARSQIHVVQELARLRSSVDQLETYLQRRSAHSRIPPREGSSPIFGRPGGEEKTTSAPGMLRSHGQARLYAGATSAALHLLPKIAPGKSDDDSSEDRLSQDPQGHTHDYDRDLIELLPTLAIIDKLVEYFFSYCTWLWPMIHHESFSKRWDKYKSGESTDRITLSTVCAMLAYCMFFLPPDHPLLEGLSRSAEDMGTKYYEISSMALQRRNSESKVYTMDLLELLLLRTQYLFHYNTDDCEAPWTATGELVQIGTAMGLHRDPGKWRMPREEAERRRWAWWHIFVFEGWQVFKLGRPRAIARHHWDTRLPSCNLTLDKTGRRHLPHLALFRLGDILGDILDDALSTRPVPYTHVQVNDRALQNWFDDLPEEMRVDEYSLARNLASSDDHVRQLAVQSLLARSSYHLIRLTLHRPYSYKDGGRSIDDDQLFDTSLELAVTNADKLIKLVSTISKSNQAAPGTGGHSGWSFFHCISAAMFFTFQLISNPEQPFSELMRSNVRTAIDTLGNLRGHLGTTATKASEVLLSLAALYSPEFLQQPKEVQEKEKTRLTVSAARQLAFPHNRLDGSLQPPDLSGNSNQQVFDVTLQAYTLSSVRIPAYLEENSLQDRQYMPAPIQDIRGLHTLFNYELEQWQPHPSALADYNF